ncbi:hypothetical protein [Aliivibrio fischeri]|uniref:Uracil-DNA glycosylase-like domain-containing protein n=1 Tax=Aliivibrio fischeri SR5 TaxID=1088719 RepID=A0AAV3EP46_ALIFS|nr:hypothetical protein [Aliivibrio fischeri]EHN68528.1 hypothetical protein VFSR5_A0610 [Aliivibrio fischeri SR5]
MNQDLENLYSSKWGSLLEAASVLPSKAASPLLIKVEQAYIDSDIKVMILGQETDGWYGQLNAGKATVENLMDGYFNYFYQVSGHGENRGKRAFWNRKNFRFFEEKLTEYFSGKSVSFIWNNISKIGNDGRGKPSPSIRKLEREYFNILAEEFAILKPDIVIFTTGSTRDSFIKHHFGNKVQFLPKLSLLGGGLAEQTLNLLAEVKIPQYPDLKAIRIEHPNRRTLSNSVSLNALKQMIEKET